jgi:regulator of cell morphogenesis and NO signaling
MEGLISQYMFLEKPEIHPNSSVASIVKGNHRTADVFRKHGIEYCCGGNGPLELACLNRGLTFHAVKKELEDAGRHVQLPPFPEYFNWNTDFLINYIVNIHHRFLKNSLPDTGVMINEFARVHQKQHPEMEQVETIFQELQDEVMPQMDYEEEIIFPYIMQIAHARDNKDSYAKLLVKTLRKPMEVIMKRQEEKLSGLIYKIRLLNNDYVLPERSCVSHTVAINRLKDLDNDLMQHIYLENDVLLPRAIMIESELLN